MVKKAKQFTVWMPNKPGTAAKFLTALGNINLLAVSVVDGVDGCAVRLVAGNATAAAKALTKAHICYSTESVLLVDLPNLPGALKKICRKLAQAKVNIEYFYGSAGVKSAEAPVVLRVSSIAKAIKALK